MSERVQCQICGKKLKHINYWHLKTHGYTCYKYKKQFPTSKICCSETSKKLGWTKGLTKETSKSVAIIANKVKDWAAHHKSHYIKTGQNWGKMRAKQLRRPDRVDKIAFCEVCGKPIQYRADIIDTKGIDVSVLHKVIADFTIAKKSAHCSVRFCSRECRNLWQSKMMSFNNPRLSFIMSTKKTDIEKIVEVILKRLNIHFVSQVQIGRRVVDFILPEHKCIIECDGEYWHQNIEADKLRDIELLKSLSDKFTIIHLRGNIVRSLDNVVISSLNDLLQKGEIYVEV